MKTNKKNYQFLKIAMNITISFVLLSNTSVAIASEITMERMIELTNKSRVEAGLEELMPNEELSRVAEAKAEDMFQNQYFEHTSPSGVTPWFWFEKIGYDYMYAAENLAIDFKSSEGTHSALMKSTGHRENILGVNYKEVGIAVVSGNFEGRETIIVVEEFGSTQETNLGKNEVFFEKLERTPKVMTVKDQNVAHETMLLQKSFGGATLNKAFSVKEPQVLKKVYTEDIYWEDVSGDRNLIAADSYKLKIKVILDSLEQRIMEIK
jgi:uncharacterized protein YkwD